MKYDLKAILLIGSALTGCSTVIKSPENSALPRSLYIVVERNSRLPVEFVTVLKSETQKHLPGSDIKIDEGAVDDQAVASADWVIALRATRIMPNYTFRLTGNSTVNGITDCLAGSGVGPGVIITPCEYSTDNDFLEASVRDVNSKTLKTYVVRQDGEGWMWPVPFSAVQTWLSGKDQQQVWLELIDTLYDKMLADGVFNI